MALEATHIKFALDFREKLGIRDFDAYIAGTIYPDSRYISGIERTETHGEFLLDPDFPTSDFKKGWMMHFVCDRAGNRAMDELFSDVQTDIIERGPGTRWWIRATALKILLDIEIYPKCDVQLYLPFTYADNPKGEPIESIQRYHAIVAKMYTEKQTITAADARELWHDFGIDASLLGSLDACVAQYQQDQGIMERIEKLYGAMVEIGSGILHSL